MEEQNQPEQVPVDHFQSSSFIQKTHMETPRSTSGLAIASLVLGILSLLGFGIFLLPPMLAVIFGHVAVSACSRDSYLDGKGMGIAGLVMGWICLAGWIVVAFFFGGLAFIASRLSGA